MYSLYSNPLKSVVSLSKSECWPLPVTTPMVMPMALICCMSCSTPGIFTAGNVRLYMLNHSDFLAYIRSDSSSLSSRCHCWRASTLMVSTPRMPSNI